MAIEYAERLPEAHEYRALFDTTGWNELYGAGTDELIAGLSASWYAVCAHEGNRLVGFGRLLSDGVLYAVVFDMIVAPDCQRQGIGGEILRRLLHRCEKAGIRDVLLFSALGTPDFYRRFGFVERPSEAPGMLLRRAHDRPAPRTREEA